MTYTHLDENRTIRWALLGSLMLHALIFIFSGESFIPRAQFSIQSSSIDTVEISLQQPQPVQNSPQNIISTVSDNKENLLPTPALKPKNFSKAIKSVPQQAQAGVVSKANPGYYQNPPPEYPELAKQMRQEGIVMLSVDVNKDGDPLDVEIIQSSGFRLLDQAALNAVKHWKFQPGRVGNIPIESSVTVPVRFRLVKVG